MLSNIETQYKFVNMIHQLSYVLKNRYAGLNPTHRKKRLNDLRAKIDKLEFFIENGE
jgi:hypothetical protein